MQIFEQKSVKDLLGFPQILFVGRAVIQYVKDRLPRFYARRRGYGYRAICYISKSNSETQL